MERIDLAIIAATPGELAPLSEILPLSADFQIAGNSFSIRKYGEISLLIGTTGIGKVNAAAITSALLSRFRVTEVWNTGCAGAYSGSGLAVGDVLVSVNCICGDEGVLNRESRHSMIQIGIPLLWKDGSPIYDCIPLEGFLARRLTRTVLPPGLYRVDSMGKLQVGCPRAGLDQCFAVQYGPSLTVGMASGDIETADERFQHHRAMAENMEGSAIAHTCLLFDVPFLEFRGISNIAGVRDKDRWDFAAAIDHSVAVVKYLLNKLFKLV